MTQHHKSQGYNYDCYEYEKHLGNYVSTNISDRNIIANVCDLYQRSNRLISDFIGCVTVKPLIVYLCKQSRV